MKALAIAATGMNAQQLNVEVIANNIANINTTGFKRARAEFTDLMYQVERLQGVPSGGGENEVPEGANLGLGVRTAAIRSVHQQGSLASTNNQLDMALNGNGWFQIIGPGGEVLYSRAGSFNTSSTGQIVNMDGYALDPDITIPAETVEVIINRTGQVFARVDGDPAPQELGQITLATFANEAGLEPLGGNLYKETTASGASVIGVPGDPGFATVEQGYLENSNVDPIREITELISAQRAYEMNSKVIQAADEMSATVAQSIR